MWILRIKKYTKKKTMIIKAVKFRKDGFYTQPFVFGGEEGAANTSARSADTFTIPPSTTEWLSKTCRTAGDARAAGSRRRNSTRREDFRFARKKQK
jgi:hypothetical protein